MTEQRHPVNLTQLGIGVLALLIGVLLYWLDRPAAQTYFMPETLSLFRQTPRLFGSLGNQLPTFLHAFAFCLISAALVSRTRSTALGICLLWAGIDSLFEIGQHPAVAARLAAAIPAWFAHVPLLDNTRSYFLHGHFDPLDLASILLGAVAAYGLIMLTRHKA